MRAAIARVNSAIGYLRCSTDRQADSGLGIEAQRASITATAARLGLPLAAVFTDAGASGSLAIDDRPVLLDAVSVLKRGDVLLVAKRDRIGRDVVEVAMVERLVTKRGARIVSAAGEGTAVLTAASSKRRTSSSRHFGPFGSCVPMAVRSRRLPTP